MGEPLHTGPRDMANTAHLSGEPVRHFLEQQVSVSERQAVVRHLVTQCPECLALTGRITAEGGYWFGAGAEAFLERDYTEAFEAAFKFTDRAARRIAVERLCGWGHWSALDPLLPNERLPAVVSGKGLAHLGLFPGPPPSPPPCLSPQPPQAPALARPPRAAVALPAPP